MTNFARKLNELITNKNEKDNLYPPHLEELSVEDMQLLAGSNNDTGETPNPSSGSGDDDLPGPPPPGARETQFDEFE